MTFRHISKVLADVMAGVELDGAPEAKRSDVPFMGSMGIKDRGALKPRQGSATQEEGRPRGRSGGPKLVFSNRGEPTHAAHEGVLTPTRRVGSPLVLVGGRDHATSPRWGI